MPLYLTRHQSLDLLIKRKYVTIIWRCMGIDKTGLSIGIIGGIGLGLMLGSEFTGRFITILGAILIIISLISMGIFSYKGKK